MCQEEWTRLKELIAKLSQCGGRLSCISYYIDDAPVLHGLLLFGDEESLICVFLRSQSGAHKLM